MRFRGPQALMDRVENPPALARSILNQKVELELRPGIPNFGVLGSFAQFASVLTFGSPPGLARRIESPGEGSSRSAGKVDALLPRWLSNVRCAAVDGDIPAQRCYRCA